jgi:hypothetical protein
VVPLLIGLGKPISLARAALPPRGVDRLNKALEHEARGFDDLTDGELDKLNAEHLRRGR